MTYEIPAHDVHDGRFWLECDLCDDALGEPDEADEPWDVEEQMALGLTPVTYDPIAEWYDYMTRDNGPMFA